jgi:hypothetical protein
VHSTLDLSEHFSKLACQLFVKGVFYRDRLEGDGAEYCKRYIIRVYVCEGLDIGLIVYLTMRW